MKEKHFLGAGFLVCAAVVGYVFFIKQPAQQAVSARHTEQRERAKADAAVNWAEVVKSKRISETEDLRLLRMPDQRFGHLRSFDTTCLIYRNSEYKTATLWCPNEADKGLSTSD